MPSVLGILIEHHHPLRRIFQGRRVPDQGPHIFQQRMEDRRVAVHGCHRARRNLALCRQKGAGQQDCQRAEGSGKGRDCVRGTGQADASAFRLAEEALVETFRPCAEGVPHAVKRYHAGALGDFRLQGAALRGVCPAFVLISALSFSHRERDAQLQQGEREDDQRINRAQAQGVEEQKGQGHRRHKPFFEIIHQIAAEHGGVPVQAVLDIARLVPEDGIIPFVQESSQDHAVMLQGVLQHGHVREQRGGRQKRHHGQQRQSQGGSAPGAQGEIQTEDGVCELPEDSGSEHGQQAFRAECGCVEQDGETHGLERVAVYFLFCLIRFCLHHSVVSFLMLKTARIYQSV